MRSRVCVALASLFLFEPVCARSADEPAEVRAIIERALQAIGGEAKLAQVITRIKGRPQEERIFSDYKETGGIKHATKLRWTGWSGADMAVQEEEHYDMEWNAQLDAAVFAAPTRGER